MTRGSTSAFSFALIPEGRPARAAAPRPTRTAAAAHERADGRPGAGGGVEGRGAARGDGRVRLRLGPGGAPGARVVALARDPLERRFVHSSEEHTSKPRPTD